MLESVQVIKHVMKTVIKYASATGKVVATRTVNHETLEELYTKEREMEEPEGDWTTFAAWTYAGDNLLREVRGLRRKAPSPPPPVTS